MAMELRPAIKRSKLMPDVMPAGEGFKFMSLEKTDNLIQYCVTWATALISL